MNANNQNIFGANLGTNINTPGVGPTLGSTRFFGTAATLDGGSAPLPLNDSTSPSNTAAVTAPFMGGGNVVGEPVAVWLWLIVLLFVLKFFSERKNSPLNPADIQIGGYNVIAIGLSAAVTFIVIKIAAAYAPLPGLKSFAAAI